VGGLKATFLTDYLHTAIALILIIYFTLTTLTHDAVGGLGGLYDKVMATASENIIAGNYEGSLLTMKSIDSIIWGLILKFGNLALVVMVRMDSRCKFVSSVLLLIHSFAHDRIRHSGKSLLLQRSKQPCLAITLLQLLYSGFPGASAPLLVSLQGPSIILQFFRHTLASSLQILLMQAW
jgi:hypothetical protein